LALDFDDFFRGHHHHYLILRFTFFVWYGV
jgi:hypothetical protein